jgi:hypothetical protein
MASLPASLWVSSSVINNEGGVSGTYRRPFLRNGRTMQAPSVGDFAARGG